MGARSTLALLVLVVASACSSENALLVDLRTDFVFGREFATVEAEIAPTAPPASGPWTGATLTSPPRPYELDLVRGARIAELARPEGTVYLRVTLRTATGEVLAQRPVLVELRGRTAVTVVMTRTCRGVACGDLACYGGRCVDVRCSSLFPAMCEAGCSSATDCPIGAACAAASCVEGACLLVADPARCEAGEWCEPERGCEVIPGAGTDAGPLGDGGLDRDASASDAGESVDAARIDAAPVDAALEVDATVPSDAGPPPECVVDTDCVVPPAGAWSACGGFASTCATGGTRTRDVTTVRCNVGVCEGTVGTEMEACARATDGTMCAPTDYGVWASCGGYSSTCDTSGTRSRTVSDHVCAGGSCAASGSSESEGCTRSTSGLTCSTTTYGAWGACGGFADVCDLTGTQSRTVTAHTCASSSCGSSASTESRSCTRASTSGTACGRAGCTDSCGSGAEAGTCVARCSARPGCNFC